jgi:hypothetical protein
MFRRAMELSLRIEGKIVTRVLNLDETIRKILILLGAELRKILFFIKNCGMWVNSK